MAKQGHLAWRPSGHAHIYDTKISEQNLEKIMSDKGWRLGSFVVIQGGHSRRDVPFFTVANTTARLV